MRSDPARHAGPMPDTAAAGREAPAAPEGGRLGAVLGEHREAILDAAAERKATAVAVVGSVARGEDTPDSDVDLLVDFGPGASLFDVSGLKIRLEELLGCEVDVISRGGLTERHSDMLRDAIDLAAAATETPEIPKTPAGSA